jgi:UDP-N-acetylmuramate-alanine ligase
MDIFEKIKLIWEKPKLIIVAGTDRIRARETSFRVLKSNFRMGKDVLLFDADLSNTKEAEKLKTSAKKSSLQVLAVTHSGQISSEADYFAGDRQTAKEIAEFAKTLPAQSFLILNFDDESMKEVSSAVSLKTLTFGFQEGADLRATDIKVNGDTNFKINFKGSTVPIWLQGACGKEKIYSALLAAAVATVLDLNLIEISQALKDYH